MISNNLWIKNEIYTINGMNTRVHLPIHCWGSNRCTSWKCLTRYNATRFILRSSTLPLRTKNGCRIRNLRRIYSLIPSIYRRNTSRALSQSSIPYDVYWSKFHILPSTLPRTKGNASTILRLRRCLH
jgi:hypothetical protein